jgi:DNA-binding phage protein
MRARVWNKRNAYVTLSPVKSKTAKPGFDRYFFGRVKDRKFASAYQEARTGIDSVDAFMRSLEEARAAAGVSKAKLARLTGTQPAAMRRLLTTDAPNPTLSTVMIILKSLGYGLALVPKRSQVEAGRVRKATPVAATA